MYEYGSSFTKHGNTTICLFSSNIWRNHHMSILKKTRIINVKLCLIVQNEIHHGNAQKNDV